MISHNRHPIKDSFLLKHQILSDVSLIRVCTLFLKQILSSKTVICNQSCPSESFVELLKIHMPKDSHLGLSTLFPTPLISHSISVLMYYHRLRIMALTAKYRM